MVFQGEFEAMIYIALPLTLKKAVKRWFDSLPQNLINSWKEMEQGFLHNFIASKEQLKSSHCLVRVK